MVIEKEDNHKNQITFSELSYGELDKIRCLFQSIMEYAQFTNSKEITEQLGLIQVMQAVK